MIVPCALKPLSFNNISLPIDSAVLARVPYCSDCIKRGASNLSVAMPMYVLGSSESGGKVLSVNRLIKSSWD